MSPLPSAFRSRLGVLVVPAPPEARLVPSLGCAVEPLIHAPEGVHAARKGGIGVVHDAVLERERADAGGLAQIRCDIGSGRGRHLGDLRYLACVGRRTMTRGAGGVHGDAGALLLLREAHLEVVVEVASGRRCPRKAPTHPALVSLELRYRRAP